MCTSKHLQCLSFSNIPELLTVSRLHACYQGCISKVPVGQQPWRNVGLAVSIGWSKEQGCCDKSVCTRQLLDYKPSRPGFPQYRSHHKLPLVPESLTPSDVWLLRNVVRKASVTFAVTSPPAFCRSSSRFLYGSWLSPILSFEDSASLSFSRTSKQIPSRCVLQNILILLYSLLNTHIILFLKFWLWHSGVVCDN